LQLTPREMWLLLGLWVIGSVLTTHYLLHGGTDLSWFLVYLASGAVAYVIVILARFIPAWHKHRL
jgi:hypothetical protein